MANEPSLLKMIAVGAAGAVAVNLLHEFTRHAAGGDPSPAKVPRLDRLGQNSLTRGLKAVGITPPREGAPRYAAAMAGDILINVVSYAAAAKLAKKVPGGSLLLPLLAGTMGLLGPKLIGMEHHTGTTPRAKAMTFGDYLVGGIVSRAVMHLIDG